jgi:hypothetical protein
MPVRHGADQTLTFWRPTVRGRHIGRGPGFVQEYEAARVQLRLKLGPDPARLDDIGALLFLRAQVFF